MLLDEEGYIERANARACSLVETGEPELIGMHFQEFCPESFESLATEIWEETLSGDGYRGEFSVLTGSEQILRTHLATKRIDGGDGVRIMLVLRDMSSEHAIDERLERATERLASMEDMQLVAQLAGGLVHDLNNMLAVITSYGQLLKSELADRPELARDAGEIIEASETAASLSRRLLAVGRDRREGDQTVEDLDLNAEIERLVSFLSRVMPPRVQLETRLDGARPILEMSGVQLEQVLMNLLLNARDAVGGDGRIVVETELLENDLEHFERPVAEVRVRDSGHGVEADELEEIFEPFFTTKTPGKGTGMGLPMVRQIVEDASGTVEVESQPGKGTCMILRFPTSSSSGSDVGIEETTLVIDETGSERVLVVDGNATSRRLIQRVLAGHGYDVIVVKDQTEARRIVTAEITALDLLILDAPPTNEQARRLADELKADSASLECIFTVEERVADTEGQNVLERPITPSSLAALVRNTLDAV